MAGGSAAGLCGPCLRWVIMVTGLPGVATFSGDDGQPRPGTSRPFRTRLRHAQNLPTLTRRPAPPTSAAHALPVTSASSCTRGSSARRYLRWKHSSSNWRDDHVGDGQWQSAFNVALTGSRAGSLIAVITRY